MQFAKNFLKLIFSYRDERSESAKRFFRDARSEAEGRSDLFRVRKGSQRFSYFFLCEISAFFASLR